jgi:phosphomannomutase/phosphoglucomutase
MPSVPASIFRSYDIRGVVGRDLDEDGIAQIGRAIGSEALSRGISSLVIGRDGRLSGPPLSAALREGLLATGIEAVDIGCASTPQLYFAAYTLAAGSGVMLTGSHNPPDYNGIKIMLGGETLFGEAIQGLLRRVEQQDYRHGHGRWRQEDIRESYLQQLGARITLARPLKLVVDCGNGVAGLSAPALFSRLGCEVVELYCEVDGRFPHHHPDPSRPENMQALIAAVRRQGADIGLAFDGDGDRLGVVSCRGEIIWPDRLMMLFARDLLERHPGAGVIYDIKCSRNLGRLIAEYGGKPEMWRSGHSLLKARLQESGALLAGEMSGHIILREGWYGVDDALYAAARLVALLAAAGPDCGKLFAELPDMMSTPELHVPMAEGEHHAFMLRLMAQQAHFAGAELTTIDGLRADYEDGWGLVRASNTTPTLVLRFEAQDEQALRRIQDNFRALLLRLEPNLHLPF